MASETTKKKKMPKAPGPKKSKDIVIRIPVEPLKRQLKIVGVAAVVIVMLFFMWTSLSELNLFGGGSYSGEPVTLTMYVMSQCPYGVQAEDAAIPAVKTFGDAVDFQLEFIVRETAPGQFSSLHGEPEVKGNIAQLCAIKHAPDDWLDVIMCMNENPQGIPGNWKACAEDLGLGVAAMDECYTGEEGKQLLSESAVRTSAAGATGSPTIYLNGESYSGSRDAGSFTMAICNVIADHPECLTLPACFAHTDCTGEEGKVGWCENPGVEDAECIFRDPVAVDAIVLNDNTCASCNPSNMLNTLKNVFSGATFRTVDVSSEEGKSLISKHGIELVPSYLFSINVADTFSWRTNSNIAAAFTRTGDMYKLSDEVSGATQYADPEARQAYLESLGISFGDNRPQVDFFVMSYCPYGNQAEEGLVGVLDLLGDKVELKPRYVLYSNYGGGGPSYCIDEANKYCSMHGIQELNQNIRELCVQDEYGIQGWFDFAIEMNTKCTYQNADTCWTAVAEGLGYDTGAITACFDANALAYCQQDFELAQLFGARGSPAVYIDGEQFEGGRTASAYAAAICAKFDTPPEECNNIPQDSTPTAQVTGTC